jgi:hypothetical protein
MPLSAANPRLFTDLDEHIMPLSAADLRSCTDLDERIMPLSAAGQRSCADLYKRYHAVISGWPKIKYLCYVRTYHTVISAWPKIIHTVGLDEYTMPLLAADPRANIIHRSTWKYYAVLLAESRPYVDLDEGTMMLLARFGWTWLKHLMEANEKKPFSVCCFALAISTNTTCITGTTAWWILA